MKPTEQIANTTSTPKTGLFATLCAFLHLEGSGAPKIGRGGNGSKARWLVLSVLITTLGALACTTAPALAADPPEAPETLSPAKSITATTATFEGVLNPKAAAAVKAGYYFAYSPEISCLIPGLTTPLQAEATVKAEKVEAKVTGLEPNKEYKFCLLATNSEGETPGNEVALETKPASPAVTGEATALPVKATEATLEAQVNPNNQSTTYKFEYSTSATGETLNAPVTTLASATVLEGFGDQTASVATGPVLAQDTSYSYRVIATNSTGTTKGTVKHFETALSPNAPEQAKATGVTATTATLNGVLNPGGARAKEPGSDEFVYKQSAGECELDEAERNQGLSQSAAPATTSPGQAEKESAQGPVSELHPGAAYTYCLLVRNEAGEEVLGPPETFTTLPAAPKIVGESAASVTVTEATLNAQIDPNGAETHYYFQYGTTESYGANTPLTKLDGTLIATDAVIATVSGLQPNTTYHYRVVATNSQSPGGEFGEEETFTTPAAPVATAETCKNKQQRTEQPYGLTLPDCRAYEMVSPVEANGQDAANSGNLAAIRAAVSGEAITYQSFSTFANPVGSILHNQYLSRRGPGGWSTQSITPPIEPFATVVPSDYETTTFTPELTKGVAQTVGSLTSEASKGFFNLYLADFASGSYQWVSNTTARESTPYAPYDVPENYVMGASADLSHVVFDGFDESLRQSNSSVFQTLYEWINGKTVLVSVANDGETLATWGAGTTNGLGQSPVGDVWHAVSADGSRIFFEAAGSDGLYLRENAGVKSEPEPEREQSKMKDLGLPGEECLEPAKACTIQVDAAEEGAPGSSGGGRYWGASAEGERVFFTDENKLTKSSTAAAGDPDLYEYQIRPGHLYGHLTDLTPESTVVNAGEHAAVQGVVQISENGSYVYFVAKGTLAPGATAQTCTGSGPGEGCNLYVSHEGGEPTFIATLAAGDATDWSKDYGPSSGGPMTVSAVVTPDGTRLAFMSDRELTGYDNEQAEAGECEGLNAGTRLREAGRCEEVYLYDAGSGGAGSLVCASCNPGGARPIGSSALPTPSGDPYIEYRPRDLFEDGVLFFDSGDALVPHAGDGRQNVYEYENGHVYPISDVAGGYESFFLDASANGENVFFGTADKLLPQDQSNNVVVYDARVDGGFPAAVPAPSCDNADSCKPPESPQPAILGAPASATFSGPGNVSPPPPAVVKKVTKKTTVKCKKGDVKNNKGKCVKKKKSKKAKAKKSAHTNRRTH